MLKRPKIMSILIYTGASYCSVCSQGTFSKFGSNECSSETSTFRINVIFSLSENQFLQLQLAFITSVAEVGGLLLSEVNIVNISEIPSRRLGSSRLLQASNLQITAEITTISSLYQSSVLKISNKTALDLQFLHNGLPAASALQVQLFCLAGQFSETLQNVSVCSNCSIGTYTSMAGFSASCQTCAVGKFTLFEGATTCKSDAAATGMFHNYSIALQTNLAYRRQLNSCSNS